MSLTGLLLFGLSHCSRNHSSMWPCCSPYLNCLFPPLRFFTMALWKSGFLKPPSAWHCTWLIWSCSSAFSGISVMFPSEGLFNCVWSFCNLKKKKKGMHPLTLRSSCWSFMSYSRIAEGHFCTSVPTLPAVRSWPSDCCTHYQCSGKQAPTSVWHWAPHLAGVWLWTSPNLHEHFGSTELC